AQAQVSVAAPPANAETLGMAVTPFNLVFLAYQGFFESEGIPKFNALVDGYKRGEITPERLIQVAIDMQRLTPDSLSDRSYVRSVQHQLRALTMDHDRD
ncbi:MAG: hypothetical protein MUF49_31210, partial [Oculatellaceae cyanobacterium Prado106]|nr:hypothetical protein [Oculatellaceae cyanobacterium Prado106]